LRPFEFCNYWRNCLLYHTKTLKKSEFGCQILNKTPDSPEKNRLSPFLTWPFCRYFNHTKSIFTFGICHIYLILLKMSLYLIDEKYVDIFWVDWTPLLGINNCRQTASVKFEKIENFVKFCITSKNGQKSKKLPTIVNLVKNRKFCQKSKNLSKIDNFVKNRKFCQKS